MTDDYTISETQTTPGMSTIKVSKTSTNKYSWEVKLCFDKSKENWLEVLDMHHRIMLELEQTYK